MELTVVCSNRLYVWFLSRNISAYSACTSDNRCMSTVPRKWTLTPLTHSICPLVKARLTSGSWGDCRVQIYFMSHLENTCLQLFLTIESQKVMFHMECLFLHTSHVSFMRKNLYNQQLTFLRHCNTCNYLKPVICNAFRYVMTVCAHSVIRPEILWPIRVRQVCVLLASSIPFWRCTWLYFNRLNLLMIHEWMTAMLDSLPNPRLCITSSHGHVSPKYWQDCTLWNHVVW
jgi:hypothetical protein